MRSIATIELKAARGMPRRRRGQKALTKLMAAVGLFLRMTARTSVIAKRWAPEAAVFLRVS